MLDFTKIEIKGAENIQQYLRDNNFRTDKSWTGLDKKTNYHMLENNNEVALVKRAPYKAIELFVKNK